MTDEKKIIESFKRYINFLNNTLDDYYKMDEEFYKDQIEQLELSLKLCNKILNLTQNQQKEIEELKEDNLSLCAKENMSGYMEFKTKFIPKSRIEEKIEGMDRNILSVRYDLAENYIYCKKILQELSESED